MVTRVGDHAQTQRLTALMMQTQSRLQKTNGQIATGHLHQSFGELGDEASLFVRTKSAREQTETFVNQNRTFVDRARSMDSSLGGMIDVMERLRSLLVQRLDATTGSELPLDVEAEGMIDQLTNLMNRQLDGRYLFAGSRTDAPPVTAPSPAAAVVADGAYYAGDDIALAARVDANVTLTYGVNAGEPPFVNAFAALGSAIQGHGANDRTQLAAALDLTNVALDGIISRRADLGTVTARAEAISESQSSSLLYLQETLSRLNDTDIPSAMTQMTLDQVSLEASYTAVAKLSQLNLADYLR
ncbi:MAG: flagellin [Pseudomonadota bacterium]